MRRYLFKAMSAIGFVAVVILVGSICWAELPGDLSIELGFNFDLVGQRYRLSDADTLDLYDEKSLSVNLTYGEAFRGGWWAEDMLAFSDRSVKNLLVAGWSSSVWQELQVKLENQLEFKDYQWKGQDLFGSGYTENRFKVEGRWPLKPGLHLGADQRLTYVDYQKRTSYFRDYWLGQTTARLECDLGLLWDLDFDYAFAVKEVPDSSGMNYLSHSLTSSLNGLMGWSFRLRLDGQLERRHTPGQEGREDYLNLTGDGELEYELDGQFSLIFRGDVEQMRYDHPDEIYYDFWTLTSKLGLSKYIYPSLSVSLLPMVRRSQAEGTSIGETYLERGIELDLNYIGTSRFWANLALEVGSRDYEETAEESFYSGYYYLHPTLLLSTRLTDQLSLDLLADHQPEWHKQKEDDFTTSLLSCSLGYHFR